MRKIAMGPEARPTFGMVRAGCWPGPCLCLCLPAPSVRPEMLMAMATTTTTTMVLSVPTMRAQGLNWVPQHRRVEVVSREPGGAAEVHQVGASAARRQLGGAFLSVGWGAALACPALCRW
jgi:hypothetical protein